jgi:hypothetical protein
MRTPSTLRELAKRRDVIRATLKKSLAVLVLASGSGLPFFALYLWSRLDPSPNPALYLLAFLILVGIAILMPTKAVKLYQRAKKQEALARQRHITQDTRARRIFLADVCHRPDLVNRCPTSRTGLRHEDALDAQTVERRTYPDPERILPVLEAGSQYALTRHLALAA